MKKNSKENIEEAVKDWLGKEAVKQEPPEGNWLFYLDAVGNVHKNPESGGEGS